MDIIRYDLDSEELKYLCKKDKRLAKLISIIGPLEYSVHTDIFAFLVHEIVEQMLSVKVGNIIYDRLVFLCDEITPTNILLHPIDQLQSTGMSKKKAQCIYDLANIVASGELDLNSLYLLSNDSVIRSLTRIKGIGPWTAKMCLIFSLNRLDIIPIEDKAFIQSYCWLYNTSNTSPASILNRCRKWGPYASLASRYMYKALDYGLTKEAFNFKN